MPLRCSQPVKAWMRRCLRRWLRLHDLTGWTVSVNLDDEDELGDNVLATCVSLPKYRAAHISILDTLPEGEVGREVLCHEVRHMHYQRIMERLDYCWDGRRRVDREEARVLMMACIEEMIEEDMELLRRLKVLR